MKTETDLSTTIGSQSYATELGIYDGICAVDGPLQPHEQQLLRTLERFGIKRLQKRRKEAQRLLRENGATHNVFDLSDSQRFWQFDPIPLVIGQEEWTQIEAGLVQRAELLNLVLADIYGPRKLLEKGLLPPELIFQHKGFLWPCTGLLPSDSRHLNIYSADLAKGKDGRFWVLEDHTQPPFGSGYALENRIVMTRSFPGMFQDFQVYRLAMYFRALQNRLSQLARHNTAEPRIVVLTPGPEHGAFFEHAFLASYLGFPLVQGGDLVVRDGCVWLKSVGGLRQVDVILLRVNDALCDPLELQGDSLYGIPGLLEAIRLGNVATSNAIGASVLQNPALLSFLPGLCRHFFGEELLLPSVATWWCGQPRERDFVLQNLDKLIIKPIHPLPEFVESHPGRRNDVQRNQLREQILAQPHLYVGQEIASLSTAPCFVTDKIEPQHCILSTFLTSENQTYLAMPGGLTRTYEAKSGLLSPKKERSFSKDTWILTTEPDKQVNLWLQTQPNQLIQPLFRALPSRAAENLFWAGRYAERAEATSRLLRTILSKLLEFKEFHDLEDRQSLEYLLRAITHVTATLPGFVKEGAEEKLADPRAELLSLACEVDRPGSLRSSLRSLGRSIYVVRDLLPADAWRVIDNMQQNWHPKVAVSQIGSGRLLDSVNQLILQLSAFSGLAHENMSREMAWLFLNIGRRLERALTLIELLRATLVPCHDVSMEAQLMESVLGTSNSLIVFRRRYRSFMQLPMILELLLKDENYPRALAYQLRLLQVHMKELPWQQFSEQPGEDSELITACIAELASADHNLLTQLSACDRSYPLLERLLVSQKERLEKLSVVLMGLYFSPTVAPQQLGGSVARAKAS